MFLFRNIQNYLVLIPAKKYIKYFIGNTRIFFWKSRSLKLEENIEYLTKSDNNFSWQCLINNNIPKKVINLYIHYILNPWLRNLKFYIEELLIWICRANQECWSR